MSTFEFIQLMLIILVLAQVSYLSYASWRGASRTSRKAQIFVDTSVLMDGRIVPLASTGFIPGVLVVPRSVVRELQLLADKADTDKRERARRGLDVVNQLQSMDQVEVEILQDSIEVPGGVDERLLELAKKYHGSICTIDFNLNKVAQVEDITVLNINELAKQLRMSYLPGDQLTLQLTQPGSDSHQSVGHLEDGTMVVVEQSRKLIGQAVVVEIIRSLQTAAGKMMFAKLVDQKQVTKSTASSKSSQNGRKPAVKSDKKPETKNSQKSRTQSQPRAAKQSKSTEQPQRSKNQAPSGQRSSSRPSSRRQDKEDVLINLINKQ